MLDLWYKNAVFYCLDVETFQDSNGDGIGDFPGLADRLDHLERLGVTCIWLNPFYPSPNRDNGYDVTDFYGVDPRHGTLGDFVAFVHAARDRGMRVIIDLVVNHTSVDHPWFRSSRSSPDSPYRDWYVWKDHEPEDKSEGIIFPGEQEEVWTRDEEADAWYLHRFYRHQADLNIANPDVRAEITRIMGFWLALGVSGFRVDAVPFLIEYKGLADIPDGRQDPFVLLTEMHDFMDWRRAEAILFAEANVPYEKAPDFFGTGSDGSGARMQLVFDFIGNQAMWLSLVRGSARPVREALAARPAPGGQGQWATFLRNHDELSLDKLTDEQRQEVYDAVGPKKTMQIYDRGLRRRLAPMLDGDPDRIALAFSINMALPGSPVIWYGDEIGLGENLDLDERNAVRCPMQWTDAKDAGFSSADPDTFVRALAQGKGFGPGDINAARQTHEAGSLLNRVRALVDARRGAFEIGRGTHDVLDAPDTLLALRAAWQGETTISLHNLCEEAVEWTVPKIEGVEELFTLVGEEPGGRIAPGASLTLPAYGYAWLRTRP